MKLLIISSIALIFVIGATNVLSEGAGKSNSTQSYIPQVIIAGKRISRDQLLVRNGELFVSIPALTEPLHAAMISGAHQLIISVPEAQDSNCEKDPQKTRLSDNYRKIAISIPDAIERLRTSALKRGAIIPADRFDEVDLGIKKADLYIQTPADKAVSYALKSASNNLGITYYKLWRGVDPEEARQGLSESVLCSAESKFALELGRLSGGESCSDLRQP